MDSGGRPYTSVTIPHNVQTSRSISESSEAELLPQVDQKDVRTSCCRIDRVILSFVILSIILCIGLSACVAILFTQVGGLKGHIQRLERQNQVSKRICQQCSRLMLGPFDDDNPLLSALDRDGDICCASTPTQTKILLDIIYQRQKNISDINGNRNSNQSKCCNDSSSAHATTLTSGEISAHLLVGRQKLSTTRKGGQQPIRNWNQVDPTAHLVGLQLNNDQLIINEKGLYLIYSQVCFSVRRDSEDGTIPILYHYVYRYNVIYPNGGKQILLRSVNNQKIEQSRNFGDLTSYTSAALMLERGDRIFVQVSNLSYVSRDPKASFFGIMKIKGG